MPKIDDRILNEIYYSPICSLCVHLLRDGLNKHKCKAFPNKIPDKIWDGTNDHMKPYHGDNGIQFKHVK